MVDAGSPPLRAPRRAPPEAAARAVDRRDPVASRGEALLAVRDLIAAIEKDRRPLADIETARVATEMISAVFWSGRLGRRVELPLKKRTSALAKS